MTSSDLSRAVWRKSTQTKANGECVELAELAQMIAVRDSKDPEGPKLFFPPTHWSRFLRATKSGTYDLS